eukprot:8812480-Alexandrium_andersonii.AAC.1
MCAVEVGRMYPSPLVVGVAYCRSAIIPPMVSFAAGFEKFSVSFIGCAFTVNNRLLNNTQCKRVLTELDNELGHAGPSNSVYKLRAVVSKAKTPPNIEATITSLVH